MQLHPTNTDPTSGALLVCRAARWNLLALLAILWLLPIGVWLFEGPWWGVLLGATIPVAVTLPIVGAFRKRGKPENWILALHRHDLWGNLRSVENVEAVPGQTAVQIPYQEIEFVRRVDHRYTIPSNNRNTRHHRDIYLELQLPSEAIAAIAAELASENKRELPEQTHLGGLVKSRTGRAQSPVIIEGDYALRIRFSSASVRLRPSLARTMAVLKNYVTARPDFLEDSDHWQNLDESEFDKLVQKLALNGQLIDATKLVRRQKQLSLRDAREYVKKLSRIGVMTNKSPFRRK